MAIIPLRQYNREIESLIDTAQLDEAIAHCRHILETFPKHIATYRLLGKAYLEQQRFGDAADIFQRVLSSVPDDHVANIGLSIIREDEGNLDAAIWYMERALEAQPSNSAIKDELRRLYGRRDGIEPPKVRLTRGALARMYSRGGLYDQAVAELRAALVDDPQRPDLMALLAQMYFYLGQQVEAVDTCGNILKRLPYCLIANRILSSILPQTGRADDTKTYHQRVIAMDPYFSSAPVNLLAADSVPDTAINIERLSYRPGRADSGPVQPAWAASLGIAFEESQADQLPDWLQDQSALEPEVKSPAQSIPVAPFSWESEEQEVPSKGETTSPEEAIPDWMKQAGWQPATGAALEQPLSFDADSTTELSEGEIAKAEIPDWLKGLAPSSAVDEEPTPESSMLDEVDLPWLQKTSPGASDTIVNWLGTQKQPVELPEEPEEPTPDEPNLVNFGNHPGVPGEEGGLPDWLQGVESSYGRSGITDWLKTSHVDEYEAQQEASPKTPEQPADEIPDWLKEMGEPVVELFPEEPAAEEPALPADELPEWLKEMEAPAAELTSVEPVVEEPALPTDELPTWIDQVGQSADVIESSQPEPEEEVAPFDDLPYWLKETAKITPAELSSLPVDITPEETSLPEIVLPDWLLEIGRGVPSTIEPTPAEPELSAEQINVGEIQPETPEIAEPTTAFVEPAAAQEEESALPGEELPAWLKEMAETPAEPLSPFSEQSDQDAALAWLESLASKHGAKEEELITPPDDRRDTMPDWIKVEAEQGQAEEPGSTPLTPFMDQTDQDAALAWLEKLASQHGAKEEELITKPEERPETIPDWVKSGAEQIQLSEPLPTEPSKIESPALPAEELPEWLQEMADLTEPSALDESHAIETGVPAQETTLPAEELPEWLQQIVEPPAETTPVAPVSEAPSAPPDLADQDAALAWLESLAVQHGAREEELITRPEERLETMPDWIKQEAESSQVEDEVPTQPVPVETIIPQIPGDAEAPESAPMPEALPELAEPISELAAIEEPVLPETELPDWLTETSVTPQAIDLGEEQAEEELPDWLKETALPEPDLLGDDLADDMDKLPDWLKEVDQFAKDEFGGIPSAELPAAPAWMPEAILPESELPTPPPYIPAEPLTVETELPVQEPEYLPPEPLILDINTASLAQFEHLPGIGFVAAQNIITYREANGPFTSIDDLIQVDGIEPSLVEALRTQLTITKPEPELEAEPVVETEETIFISARQAVAEGEVSLAADLYNRLVMQRTNLNQVITDMQDALYRYPLDINFWQIMGDAYLRTDKLQEALDAYTKAEELLR